MVNQSGTIEVTASSNTTYILVAHNPHGTANSTVRLVVIPTVTCGNGVCEGENDCCYDLWVSRRIGM